MMQEMEKWCGKRSEKESTGKGKMSARNEEKGARNKEDDARSRKIK